MVIEAGNLIPGAKIALRVERTDHGYARRWRRRAAGYKQK
jgi:hypothetical protein